MNGRERSGATQKMILEGSRPKLPLDFKMQVENGRVVVHLRRPLTRERGARKQTQESATEKQVNWENKKIKEHVNF